MKQFNNQIQTVKSQFTKFPSQLFTIQAEKPAHLVARVTDLTSVQRTYRGLWRPNEYSRVYIRIAEPERHPTQRLRFGERFLTVIFLFVAEILNSNTTTHSTRLFIQASSVLLCLVTLVSFLYILIDNYFIYTVQLILLITKMASTDCINITLPDNIYTHSVLVLGIIIGVAVTVAIVFIVMIVQSMCKLRNRPSTNNEHAPCNRPNTCRYCHRLDKVGQIAPRQNPNRRYITVNTCDLNCQCSNLIYCITCNICGERYVGQTKNRIVDRIGDHFGNIKRSFERNNPQNSTTVARHFKSHGNRDYPLTITILEFIKEDPNSLKASHLRDSAEQKWIARLNTLHPYGLNVE